MKKACCDCAYLSSYGGSSSGGSIDCKMHRTQHVNNPFEHVRTYVCDNFAPETISDSDPKVLAALLAAQRYGNSSLKKALDTWFLGPPNDITVSTNRGLPMLSIADNDLNTFEGDTDLKSYHNSNHIFADFFGGVDVNWPLIFYLSHNNKPGVRVDTLGNNAVSVLYLGKPYSFAEVTAAISYIFRCQGIKLIRPWFLRHLRSFGLNPNDPSFESFLWLTHDINFKLTGCKNIIRNSHAIISIDDAHVDEGAFAEALGYNYEEYAILWCDADREFHLSYLDESTRNFSSPEDISQRLSETDIKILLLSPTRWYSTNLWSYLPDQSFDSLKSVIAIVDRENLNWVQNLTALKNFTIFDFSKEAGESL